MQCLQRPPSSSKDFNRRERGTGENLHALLSHDVRLKIEVCCFVVFVDDKDEMSIPVRIAGGGVAYVFPDPSSQIVTLGSTAVFPSARVVANNGETGLLSGTPSGIVTTKDAGASGVLHVDETGEPSWVPPAAPSLPASVANGGTGGDTWTGGSGWMRTYVDLVGPTVYLGVDEDATPENGVGIAITLDVDSTSVQVQTGSNGVAVASLSNFCTNPSGAIAQNSLFAAASVYIVASQYASEVGTITPALTSTTVDAGATYGPYLLATLTLALSGNSLVSQLLASQVLQNGDGTTEALQMSAFFCDSSESISLVANGNSLGMVAPLSTHSFRVVPTGVASEVNLVLTTTYPYSTEVASRFAGFDWASHVMLVLTNGQLAP